MILRLSQKLSTKIKAGSLKPMPLDDNPFADWTAHLFVADRTQYIIVSNTKSLYSTVLFAKGITNDSRFIERALGSIREFMQDDSQEFVYRRFIVPASGTVSFAKAEPFGHGFDERPHQSCETAVGWQLSRMKSASSSMMLISALL
jgi:hypothetical protein